jgi:hypothetical protein
MNDNLSHDSNDEAFAAQIRRAAQSLQPSATFSAQLDHELKQGMNAKWTRSRTNRNLRLWATAAALAVFAVSAIFTVPSLRALAQEIIDLLTNAASDTIVQEVDTPADIQVFESVEDAETALLLDFAEPQILPSPVFSDGNRAVHVRSVLYTPEYQSLEIRYEYSEVMWWMVLKVTPADVHEYSYNLIGESADIEIVPIVFQGQAVSAQFVRGSWGITSGLEALPPGIEMSGETVFPAPGNQADVNTEWNNDSGAMQLTWEANGVVYSLHSVTETVMRMDKFSLIRIAESIE